MAEYLVKTDKPIRLDEVLHLHGIHHYSVQRLEKHGRLIDEAKLRERAYAIQRRDRISFTDALAMALIEAETIVEATE